jgi:FKBP-type peptidyl-prolyl cis-trans isomerase FklB
MRRVSWMSLAGLVSIAILGGCTHSTSTGGSGSLPDTMASDGKVSPEYAYAVGLAFGRRIRDRLDEDKLVADESLIVRGLRDALDGREPRYPEDQMEGAIAQIERAVRERYAKRQMEADPALRKVAEENLKNSHDAMERLSKLEGVEVLSDGVLRRAMKHGSGRFVANATKITVNFQVALADGAVVKASEAGKPTTAYISRLPKAVQEAVRDMRVGDTWRLGIPPEKAYGVAGLPPIIGANQALLMQIEVLSVE